MEKLEALTNEINCYESKMLDLLDQAGDNTESPLIVIENLTLITAILANCKAHLQLQINILKSSSDRELSKYLEKEESRNENKKSDIKVEVADERGGEEETFCDNNQEFIDSEDLDKIPTNENILGKRLENSTEGFSEKREVIKEDIKDQESNGNDDHPYSSCHDEGTAESRNENNEQMAEENECKSETGEDESDVKYENHSAKDFFEEPTNEEVTLPKKTSKKLKIQKLRTKEEPVTGSLKTFRCELCKRAYYTQEKLKLHLESFDHSKTTCTDCGKVFFAPAKLERHKMIHTGERPYCCDVCGKTFQTKEYVELHKQKIHGNITFSEPCQICGKIFPWEQNLRNHMNYVHNMGQKSYSCDQCGKAFNQKTSLTNHMEIHQEERPVQCDLCEKTFKSVRNMKRHKKTHSVIKPYQCDECEFESNSNSYMVQHYKRVHKMIRAVPCKPPIYPESQLQDLENT